LARAVHDLGLEAWTTREVADFMRIAASLGDPALRAFHVGAGLLLTGRIAIERGDSAATVVALDDGL
jgi:hypothetical protein